MLNHGGRLREAAQHYDIPLAHWTDLSTGINPNGYPIPYIPAYCWQRLPEEHDDLLTSAKNYYQSNSLLAVAGSQAAIQNLPLLRTKGIVGCLIPSYAEHAHTWQTSGHTVQLLTSSHHINRVINKLDTLILVNPNNPSGEIFSAQDCLSWLDTLNKRQGWLIIDEAFIDAQPALSLSTLSPLKGLIILRSIGKFFGLAGLRTGFVLAEPSILKLLEEKLGPWPISTPSRFVTSHALQNTQWQANTRQYLQQHSKRLHDLLTHHSLTPSGSTLLFQWVKTLRATQLHQQLAQQAIFTRLFTHPHSLRFGLPANEEQWQHLENALKILKI